MEFERLGFSAVFKLQWQPKKAEINLESLTVSTI